MDRKNYLKGVKRIVVKVGTSNLTDERSRLDSKKIGRLVKDIMSLRKNGKEVIIVTSGAIGAGIGKLNLKQRPRDIPMLQATAAVGQNILMRAYEEYFNKYNQTIAQVLLTREDFFNRGRYLNVKNTLSNLLKLNVIPIINENDTVAIEEIKFGDNDNLSALVASNLEADLLLMLSDIDGLYTWDPRKSKRAVLIKEVREINSEIEKLGGKATSRGLGGMKTKIQAAKITSNSGISLILINGNEKNVIKRVMSGEEIGTIFLSTGKLADREHWIAFVSSVKGIIKVDNGAKKALIERGSSLLPAGIIDLEGNFSADDTVSIVDVNGKEFARGITNYSSSDVRKIKGVQTKDIKKILGKKDHNEVIYRGNLVLI